MSGNDNLIAESCIRKYFGPERKLSPKEIEESRKAEWRQGCEFDIQSKLNALRFNTYSRSQNHLSLDEIPYISKRIISTHIGLLNPNPTYFGKAEAGQSVYNAVDSLCNILLRLSGKSIKNVLGENIPPYKNIPSKKRKKYAQTIFKALNDFAKKLPKEIEDDGEEYLQKIQDTYKRLGLIK